jgi:CHAD domain-containing protein
MRHTHSPRSLLQDQLSKLTESLPGIREGLDEAIHDARVALRRIEETFALESVASQGDEPSDASRTIRRVRAALGEARDSDVLQNLLSHLDRRLPPAAPVIATLRHETSRARLTARRRLIKKIEGVDLAGLQPAPAIYGFATGDWKGKLRMHVGERAADVARSIEHASGVYFPKRAHTARLAIKKLRYALELAHDTGAWHAPRAIRRLRKAQDVLGQVHDRQVLLDRLDVLPQANGSGHLAVEALVAFLEAEILTLYDRYLGMRTEINGICDACERSARRRPARRVLVAATAALPALMLLGRRSAPAVERPARESDDVRVKVRVGSWA